MSKLKPQRIPCSCQASLHPLVNNCTSCGKIVCDKEKPGPCLFCGNLVFPRSNNSQIPELAQNLPEDPEFQRAEELKQRLLQYDASQIADTNVFDEQTDWFEINENVWSSKEAKNFAAKKIEAENTQKEEFSKSSYMAFDGTAFIEEKKGFDHETSKKEVRNFIIEQKKTPEKGFKGDEKLHSETKEVFEGVQREFNEKYKDYLANKEKKTIEKSIELKGKIHDLRKVFNEDENYDKFLTKIEETAPLEEKDSDFYDIELYSENQDKGKCLSMLQPWASLLIQGFKRFEGRFWDTEYRGPLWIHAGGTPPTEETLRFVEQEYRDFYKSKEDSMPKLPERYPLGSLLGLVDLQTVLAGSLYREKVPKEFREKNESEHIFVIRNPRKLLYPIKMPGSKDIFDISGEILKVARKCLRRVPSNWWDYYANNLIDMDLISERKGKKEERVDSRALEVKEEKKASDENFNKEVRKEEGLIEKKEVFERGDLKERSYKRKIEKLGFCIVDFFKEGDLWSLKEFLQEKSIDSKATYVKNSLIIPFTMAFPFYEPFLQLFLKEIPCFKIKGLQSGVFFINKKQKPFEIEGKTQVLMVIGPGVSLNIVNLKDSYQLDLTNNSLYFIPKSSKTTFQRSLEQKKTDIYNLLIFFTEKD